MQKSEYAVKNTPVNKSSKINGLKLPGTISITAEKSPARVYMHTLNGIAVQVRKLRRNEEPLSDVP